MERGRRRRGRVQFLVRDGRRRGGRSGRRRGRSRERRPHGRRDRAGIACLPGARPRLALDPGLAGTCHAADPADPPQTPARHSGSGELQHEPPRGAEGDPRHRRELGGRLRSGVLPAEHDPCRGGGILRPRQEVGRDGGRGQEGGEDRGCPLGPPGRRAEGAPHRHSELPRGQRHEGVRRRADRERRPLWSDDRGRQLPRERERHDRLRAPPRPLDAHGEPAGESCPERELPDPRSRRQVRAGEDRADPDARRRQGETDRRAGEQQDRHGRRAAPAADPLHPEVQGARQRGGAAAQGRRRAHEAGREQQAKGQRRRRRQAAPRHLAAGQRSLQARRSGREGQWGALDLHRRSLPRQQRDREQEEGHLPGESGEVRSHPLRPARQHEHDREDPE